MRSFVDLAAEGSDESIVDNVDILDIEPVLYHLLSESEQTFFELIKADLMADHFAFYVMANSYLRDAETLFRKHDLGTFNVSSFTDDGGATLNLAPTDLSKASDPATGANGSLLFILGHAIELYMKSILLRQGANNIKRFGHNLTKIVEKVERGGVSIPDRELIIQFSETHKNMEYRYPENARTDVINPSLLYDAALSLDVLASPIDEIYRVGMLPNPE